MNQKFVTAGRAIIAYIVGITTGAIAFVPLLVVISSRGGEAFPVSRPDQGLLAYLFFWLRVELGSILVTFMLPAVPMFPFFAAAMVFARWRQISHWLYYIMLGVVMATSLCLTVSTGGHAPALLHSEIPIRIVLLLAMPVGVFGGAACWLFLRMTYSET